MRQFDSDPAVLFEGEDVICETVTDELSGGRADAVAASLFGMSRSGAERLMSEGNIFLLSPSVERVSIQKKRQMKAGEVMYAILPEPEPLDAKPENIPLDVRYEDNDVIVINKPRGMVVHPAPGHADGTLVSALLYHCGDSLSGIGGVSRPGIVHRIDKDTSGLIAVAKNDAAHMGLAAQLENHSMFRRYRAIVVGGIKEDGTVDAPIARHPVDRKRMAVSAGGRRAVTHYEVDKSFPGFTLLRLRLETGRTHQIRVHMAHIGHPVLGDPVYGGDKTQFQRRHPALFEGQCLHAETLTFTHPRTGENVTVTAPLPDYFEEILRLMENTL